MKEFLTIFTVTLAVIWGLTWITPAWLKAIMEWILCVAVILLFLPNMFF